MSTSIAMGGHQITITGVIGVSFVFARSRFLAVTNSGDFASRWGELGILVHEAGESLTTRRNRGGGVTALMALKTGGSSEIFYYWRIEMLFVSEVFEALIKKSLQQG